MFPGLSNVLHWGGQDADTELDVYQLSPSLVQLGISDGKAKPEMEKVDENVGQEIKSIKLLSSSTYNTFVALLSGSKSEHWQCSQIRIKT